MKIDPIHILLERDFKINKKFYFVSGNEVSYIGKVSSKIIKKYKSETNASITKIDSISNFTEEIGLFDNKKIFLVESCKKIDVSDLDKVRNTSGIFIITQENSQKIKKVKEIFVKDKDAYLIDCFELDKRSKIRILSNFLETEGIVIEESLYWFLIDKLDNRYAFLENSLNKLSELEKKDLNLFNIKKLLSIGESGKEKLFFNLLKKNKEIVLVYRDKITSSADVNELYYHCRFLCQLILDSKDEYEYAKKIPVYLFKERSFLLDLYKKYNSKKKSLLLKLLYSAEIVLRKESSLSLAFGLRFLLNIRKITIS